MTPLRIAVLTANFPRASETPFTNILTGLARRGHALDIFANAPERGTTPHPSIAETGLDRRTLHPRPWQGGAAGFVRAALAARRAPWRRRALDPFAFGIGVLDGSLMAAAEPLEGRGPWDVAYATFGHQGIEAMRYRRLGLLRAPLFTSFRGADISLLPQRHGAGVYRDLFREGEWLLPVCRAFVPRLEALGAPPARIRVHPTGLDVGRFAWRARRPGADDGTTWLVTAARLVAKKGIDNTLQAVRRLRDAGHDVRYRVLGRGPLQPRLEALIAELRLGDAVELLGYRSDVATREIMSASDVAVLASVTTPEGDAEGIPNVLKEAMLLGLPVVSTRHSGIPELVDDGVTGWLVPERDPAALAAAVERLIAERTRWPEMGEAGRRVVERDYDIEVLNDRLEGMMLEVGGAKGER